MGAAAIADFLTDFGQRPRSVHAAIAAAQPVEPPAPPAPLPDIDAIVAEAVAQAEAALTHVLRSEHDRAIEALEARHAEALASLEARLGVEMGTAVSTGLAEIEGRLTTSTAAVATRILGQIASDTLARRAVEDLARLISDATADAETIRIKVRGPQSMMMPLTAALGDLASHVEFTESTGIDLTVAIDETLFETRLADWSASLSEILQ